MRRLRAVSLFPCSVEQNARDTQMTTRLTEGTRWERHEKRAAALVTCGLSQIVKVLTRDTGTLHWCLTNHPKLCPTPIQLPKIGSSDHYCVLVPPGTPVPRACERTIVRRDTRNSQLRDFGRWVTMFSWDYFFSLESTEEKFEYFHQTLPDAADKFLPSNVSRIHGNDKPWMNERVKATIRKRQKLVAHCGKDSRLFRHSRNMV